MKKTYIIPKTEVIRTLCESILNTASPGVGPDYDPNAPIEAKPHSFFGHDGHDMEDYDDGLPMTRSLWDE